MAKKKSELLKPDYTVVRGVNLTLYDLQGGPVPPLVIKDLESYAEKLAKKHNLALSSVIVERD